MDSKGQKYYEIASSLAQKANHLIEVAGKTLNEYKIENERLDNWKKIMSTAPVRLLSALFVVIAIVEYLISVKIYEEFIPRAPWVVALGFLSVGVLVSEFIVYKISKAKRKWKKYELKRDPNNKNMIEPEIDAYISKFSNSRFIIGLIIGIFLIAMIGFLSYKRVQYEIGSEMRPADLGFGIMDLLPLLLYIVEILTGIYVWYLIKEINLSLKVKSLLKKFNNITNQAHKLTSDVVHNFSKSEQNGLDLFNTNTHIGEHIHTSFYRNKQFSLDDKEQFIKVPSKINEKDKENVFNVQVKDQSGNPIKHKNIFLVTEYKFTHAGAINQDGRFSTYFQGTFEGDAVRKILIELDDKKIVKQGNWDLNQEIVHEIII